MTITYQTLATPDLREGDLVYNHGMCILIDGPAAISWGFSGGVAIKVYAWPGLVTNADEICDKKSGTYDAYIACHIRGQWWEDMNPRPRKDDWPIQGNHLATWSVGRQDGS